MNWRQSYSLGTQLRWVPSVHRRLYAIGTGIWWNHGPSTLVYTYPGPWPLSMITVQYASLRLWERLGIFVLNLINVAKKET